MISSDELQKRKHKAIETFIATFGGSYQLIKNSDVEYKLIRDGQVMAYAEITPRMRNVSDAYPLIIPTTRIVKLAEKRLNPLLIWACDDGLIYARLKDVECQTKWGSFLPHLDLAEHGELMCYYTKQKHFKYIKYN